MNILINNLDFSYINNEIFTSLNLNFSPNKLHGILGPNGCGKTTLLKTILKLLKVNNASIFIDKMDINNISRDKFAKQIAYVEQSSNQLPQIIVKDYIKLARYIYNDYNQGENKIVEDVIKLLKIEDLKFKYLNQLSGGELQKVILARALSQETKILILDEPTANLDPLHQLEIMNVLKDLVKKKDLTIITTLHDINLALSFCDEIVLINKDKKIQGPTDKIINKENIKTYFKLDSSFTVNPFTNKAYVILNH